MSSALLHGLPVVIVIVLIALLYRRIGRPAAPYRLNQPWTNEPILWSAIQEPIPSGHQGNHHGGAESTLIVGGGASGRW